MTSTTLDPDLLRAVLADPDNTSLRLACADWLDENGDPVRAEYIKIQCELAGIKRAVPGSEVDIRRAVLRRRRQQLGQTKRLRQWFPVLGDGFEGKYGRYLWYFGIPHDSAVFKRGFVEMVRLTWAEWDKFESALLAAAPLREVYIHPDGQPDVSNFWLKCKWPRIKFTFYRYPI